MSDRMSDPAAASSPLARAVSSRLAYSPRGYAWRRTLSRLAARPFASGLTLLVLGIVLALPVLLSFLAGALDDYRGSEDQSATLTAYLALDVDDLDGATLATQLAARPGILSTRYVSRDEALATFRAESDLGGALDVLDSNPLPGAIVIAPERATTGQERMQALAAEIEQISDIERVRYDLQWVERLRAVVAVARIAAALLAGFLILTALLVVGNTIRLELLDRRAEREVSHLLGAGRSFMNRPFIYTGLLYGLLGGVIAVLIAMIAFSVLKAPADELAGLYGANAGLKWPPASLIGLIPASGALLGLIGALSTLYGPSRQKILSEK